MYTVNLSEKKYDLLIKRHNEGQPLNVTLWDHGNILPDYFCFLS